MAPPFRLRVGAVGLAQQSGTTCGSACLAVTRMLTDPPYAQWVLSGDGSGPGTRETRFAAAEEHMARLTNGLRSPTGRLQVPWPRALGTPPWGARSVVDALTGAGTGAYAVRWVRLLPRGRRETAYEDLRSRVTAARPALLYVGNAVLPRHVVLVLPGTGGAPLDAYEPAHGQVHELAAAAFADRRLALAGWQVPWALVLPAERAAG